MNAIFVLKAGDLAIKLSGIESKCVKKYDGRKLCESIAIFENVSYEHTGVYTCHHGSPEDNQSSNNIYIFVNGQWMECLKDEKMFHISLRFFRFIPIFSFR